MILKELNNNVCRIAYTSSKQGEQGTGFLISRTLVLTAFHVVNKYAKNDIEVHLNGTKTIATLHELIDDEYKKMDVAILKLENPVENYNHLELVDVDLSSGSEWQTRGYPSFKGTIGTRVSPDGRNYINEQLDEPHENNDLCLNLDKKFDSYAGFSGSPLIVNNNIVGVIKSEFLEKGTAKELNALSVKYFKKLLEKVGVRVHSDFFTPLMPRAGLTTKLESEDFSFIKKTFEQNLNKALKSFSTQPNIWVVPKIHTRAEDDSSTNKEDTNISIDEIINVPKSLIIRARQQYGLSSLSRYLIKKAWESPGPSFWLYLDAKELKPHSHLIEKIVLEKLEDFGLKIDDIDCVILDEFSPSIKDANKIFEKVSAFFKNKSLVVMFSDVENPLETESIDLPLDRNFESYYLWALPREHIREIVHKYNDKKSIGDENLIITKVVQDLEVLNIPRTPLNCLTLLKISEAGFDDSPVNRTEMLGKVLALLFNVDSIPQYKTRPDLKDTEYVLGYFAEIVIRNKRYAFSREYFLETLHSFCTEEEIDLEIDLVFDVLHLNNIIVERAVDYCFKFSYWIFYFAAHRMYKSQEFLNYILEDMHYASYPEMIEFYTGIDRNRSDALEVIVRDLKNTRNEVEKKCGLPEDFNLYNIAQWKPSQETIARMNDEVSDSVSKSNLPDTVKDAYEDKFYNQARPLNQNIHTILEEYSLLRLVKSISSASTALRNSDYTSPKIRHELLEEILRSWEQLIRVLLILTPILAKDGLVTLEGATFQLNGNFGEDPKERLKNIIPIIPMNIVMWYKDDLFSQKMRTLLFKRIENTENRLTKHILCLLIIKKRPKEWNQIIEEYIVSENKNSFYLQDIYNLLKVEEKYSFATEGDLRVIRKLMKMTVKKHDLGMDKPSAKALKEKPVDIKDKEESKEKMKKIFTMLGLKND